MLESFISYEKAVKRPYLMFAWAFILSSVAFFLSTRMAFTIKIGSTSFNMSGLFSIIFIVLPAAYFLTTLINREEAKEEEYIEKKYKKGIWERNETDAYIFLAFFFGVVFSFAIWSFFLQQDFFQVQKTEISKILGISGNITGMATGSLSFVNILLNNMNVVFLSFIFSLLFGAGVTFILSWNAGLLGVRIAQLAGGISDIPAKSLQFLPHGIFEIGSFVLAGLAGGIISAAVLREHHKSGVFKSILINAGILFALALVFVTVGAWIEVL